MSGLEKALDLGEAMMRFEVANLYVADYLNFT